MIAPASLTAARFWTVGGSVQPGHHKGSPAWPVWRAGPLLTALAALALGAASCTPAVETPNPADTPTATPEPTATLLLAVTRPPTATPAPLTPLPTATPTITPTPVIYTIQKGDNLLSIANQYGVTLQALQEANGILDPRRLQIGQELVIPLDEAALTEPSTPTPTPVPVAIENVNFLETPTGGLWCLGEVRNLTSQAAEMIQVQVSLYDDKGSPLAYQSVFTLMDEVEAGERTPFALLFHEGPLRFATYQIVPLSAVPARDDNRVSL
ncbi:MAG: LysM peptidoglycan-binding domain-containing protein, partial [Chloroflexi bacterium]|nr:LysM peptidoglycan-binding domain-containing protein [Chloroflexota bacterium]